MILTSEFFYFLTLFLWAIGAIGSLFLKNNDKAANYWGGIFAILGSVFGIVASSMALISSAIFSFSLASSLPLLSFTFSFDKLSAFFVLIISVIAFLSSIYGLGYSKHYYKKYNLGTLGFFYNLFLVGMLMVVTASNALFFLIVWEIMSLASYFLVVFENKQEENIKAGSLYFIMTHVGTAFITTAFLLLYRATGSLDFASIAQNISVVAPATRNIIFILAFIGFGTKAGIIPFHIWLPIAHPAAPSHVSALMSGVMIKTGIYMMIRIFIGLMPVSPLWWGIVVLLFGAFSSLLGVLYALTEHDIKKLLAYHSIENIGIILLGLGSSMIFWSLGMPALATLALVAALFHTLNHAIFKALLFLGAGSVISETHTRNMEEFGGLIKYMPQTAFFFLIGAMAISALPPFNGFFSEWMTFQALFSGIIISNIYVSWAFVLAGGALAFTGGLAAMCFVKAFGVTFLARPRSNEVKHAKESGISLRIGMGVLAGLTLVIGFSAGKISGILADIVNSLNVFNPTEPAFYSNIKMFSLNNGLSSVSMPLILIILLIALLATYIVVELFAGKRKVKIGRTWDCGTNLNGRMEITSSGFARSIIVVFRGILRPTEKMNVEYFGEGIKYFPKSNKIEFGISDVYNSNFYQPVRNFVSNISGYVKKIQSGNVNTYILYLLVTLIVLFLVSSF